MRDSSQCNRLKMEAKIKRPQSSKPSLSVNLNWCAIKDPNSMRQIRDDMRDIENKKSNQNGQLSICKMIPNNLAGRGSHNRHPFTPRFHTSQPKIREARIHLSQGNCDIGRAYRAGGLCGGLNYFLNSLGSIPDCFTIARNVPIGRALLPPCNGTGTICPDSLLRKIMWLPRCLASTKPFASIILII